jgi:hypothetical protein
MIGESTTAIFELPMECDEAVTVTTCSEYKIFDTVISLYNRCPLGESDCEALITNDNDNQCQVSTSGASTIAFSKNNRDNSKAKQTLFIGVIKNQNKKMPEPKLVLRTENRQSKNAYAKKKKTNIRTNKYTRIRTNT